jgi:hypothetical protein
MTHNCLPHQVRLKMLRAIHGRKLATADLRVKELERECDLLKGQVRCLWWPLMATDGH